MKTLAEIKHILKAPKPYLAHRYGVTEIGVFGSYVRDEQRPDSDVDILVDLERPPRIDLLDLVNLGYYLGDLA
jgi:predicted nucleotidyltransferase